MTQEIAFEFHKKTGKESLTPNDYGGYYYSDEYVDWLEIRTSKLEKDLKDAETMFEKMELTAFNLEKKITKLEELIRLQGELWNNIDMSSYSVSKHWETLHKQINKLKKELKL